MSHLICLAIGCLPVLIMLAGSYLTHTALNEFWAAQPADSDPGTGWQRLRTTEFGKRYKRGYAVIVVGQVLLVGVIVLATLSTALNR